MRIHITLLFVPLLTLLSISHRFHIDPQADGLAYSGQIQMRHLLTPLE